MQGENIQILDQEAIHQRLRRMAYEIYETHFQEKELLVIGIDERGGALAQELAEHLLEISPIELTLVEANLDRESDDDSIGIELSIELEEIKGKPVLIVDDVLYTGKTLLNVVAILLYAGPKTIRTAILIDRGHRKLPVSPDYTGLELATTFHQHVEFVVKDEFMAAYLH